MPTCAEAPASVAAQANDDLHGDESGDLLWGAGDDDIVRGNDGPDNVHGGHGGTDQIYGGAGVNDTCYGAYPDYIDFATCELAIAED